MVDTVALGIILGLTLLLLAVFAIVLFRAVCVIPPYAQGVLTVLGSYRRLLNPGFHVISPMARVTRVDLRSTVVALPAQSVVTLDNCPLLVDAVLSYRIVDAPRATFQVRDLPAAMVAFAQTGVRSVVGAVRSEELPSARARLNQQLRSILEEKSGSWGVKVESAEIKEAEPHPAAEVAPSAPTRLAAVRAVRAEPLP